MSQLYIDRLLKNPDAIVLIRLGVGAGGKTEKYVVQSFLTEDFSFSAAADWSSPYENYAKDAAKLLRPLTDLAKAIPLIGEPIMNFLGGGGNPTFLSFATSIVDYYGTSRPEFSLNLVFIATDAKKDPRRDIFKLLSGVFPTRAPGGFAGPPLSFKSQLGEVLSGFVTLQIGRSLRFMSPPLIIKGVSPKFSKAPTSAGIPLYAEATVSFEFALTPSIDDVRGWFLDMTGV
jgi:hypothetical protein